jgi:hypothetical protein
MRSPRPCAPCSRPRRPPTPRRSPRSGSRSVPSGGSPTRRGARAASHDVLGRQAARATHPGPRASGSIVERRVQPRRHTRGHHELGRHRTGVERGDWSARHPPARASGLGGEPRVQARRHPRSHHEMGQTARVWDAATGEPLTNPSSIRARWRAPRSALTGPAWSPRAWTRPRGSGTRCPASRSTAPSSIRPRW